MNFNTNIQFIKGVGEVRAKLFNKLGIDNVGALLHFFPRTYIHWNEHTPLSKTLPGIPAIVKVKVETGVRQQITRSRMSIFSFLATDGRDTVKVTLFNTKFTAEKISYGDTIILYGVFEKNLAYYSISSPTICFDPDSPPQPIYPQTSGLKTTTISKIIKTALESTDFNDPLPQSVVIQNNLCSYKFALQNIHFPKDRNSLEIAKKRLIFQELFILQISLLFRKQSSVSINNYKIASTYFKEYTSLLPFELTTEQTKAIRECIDDMSGNKQMRRLLQGDVGSGKTAVAAAIAHSVARNGYQTVLMVPTEILAEQHYKTFSEIFKNTDINIALLTGSLTKKNKDTIKEELANGKIDILIGTHAVIQDDVVFNSLALVITDEQHRFGVEQRTKLSSKGKFSHILVMSATPIPRTLSLIIFGDLDISTINTLPRGRQPIETFLIDAQKRERAYNYIIKHLLEGKQGYIVCPAVEENDVDLISATEYFNKISAKNFKGFSVGLLHGKMPHKEKDLVMRQFLSGEIQLLVATTVIEVGIDVPNAVIMMIENAERFGLSQLHQLRGRIGRGKDKSTCILINNSSSDNERLNAMCKTSNGFEIAEQDLKLRGPGDFIGQRQHGLPELKIANLIDDINIFKTAGIVAKNLLAIDPTLKTDENQPLKSAVKNMFANAEKFDIN